MSSTSLLIHQGMLLFQVYVHDEVLSIHICGIYDYIRGWGCFPCIYWVHHPLSIQMTLFLYLIINEIFVNIYVIYEMF